MTYRFTIIDYTINSAGVTTVLTNEPEGWNEIKIEARRDPKWHGVFMDFTLNKLSFHAIDAGFEEIKAAYEDSGVEAETDLVVEIDCGDGYEEAYRGRLMYSDYQINYGDSCSIEIGVEQKSCLRTLKTRYDHKVNLTATQSFNQTALTAYDNLPLDNMTLYSRPIKFLLSASGDGNNISDQIIYTTSGGSAYRWTRNFVVNKITDDIETFTGDVVELNEGAGETLQDYLDIYTGLLSIDNLTDINCNDNESSITLTLSISTSINFASGSVSGSSCVPNTQMPYDIRFRLIQTDSSSVIKSNQTLGFQTDCIAVGDTDVILTAVNNQTYDFTIVAGDRFYIVADLVIGDGMLTSVNSTFNITITVTNLEYSQVVTSYCNDSTADVFLIHEALSRTSEIITDGCLPVYSEYYGRIDSDPFSYAADGCAGLRCIASGSYIRNATKTDGTAPDFFASLKDLFEGLNAIDNIGMGIEEAPSGATDDVLRIETVDYWYDSTIIHTCDDVKEIVVKIDEKRIYSACEIGYNEWEAEYTGGRDDLHANREYRTPITQTANRLDQKSNMIASGYVIEVLKRLGSTSEDDKYDDKIFILCLDRSYATFTPERLNSTGSNILSPLNMVNERITPIRNLMRWYRSFTAGIPTPYRIRFNAGTGNYIAELLFTDLDSCLPETQVTSLAENNLISRNNFKTASEAVPLWIPELIEFEYPLSWAEFKAIRSNSKGTVKVTQGSLTLYGFIVSLVYQPNQGLAKWTLLRSNI